MKNCELFIKLADGKIMEDFKMIRVILVALFMFIVFIVSLIMLPLEWLIGKININAKDISSLANCSRHI